MFFNILRKLSTDALQTGVRVHKMSTLSTQFVRVKTNISTSFFGLKSTPNIENGSIISREKPLVLDKPFPNTNPFKEIPYIANISYLDKINWDFAMEEPTKVIEKQAARLIVIRRRKMKRHKLKKLRRKMKFEWAKVRQRRELRKEKAFQEELMGKIRESQKFDAAIFAKQKISQANEVLIPKLWKGKRLPEFVIKELIVEQNNKRTTKTARKERRSKMSFNVSDYNV